jgi:hypothetical protein
MYFVTKEIAYGETGNHYDIDCPPYGNCNACRQLYRIKDLTHSMEQSPSGEANRFSVKKFPPCFMEPEGTIPHSQSPAIYPYPEPDQSGPCPHIPLPEDTFYIILPSMPGSSKWSLSLRFPTKIPYKPLLSPYVLNAHRSRSFRFYRINDLTAVKQPVRAPTY